MDDVRFCVIDKEGTNLFHIEYVPPLGSTLHYCVDWNMMEYHQAKNKGTGAQFTQESIDFWKSIDGKYWTVADVYCEVRNYSGKEVCVHFVEVVEKL